MQCFLKRGARVVLASSNAGKVRELQQLLSDLDWQIVAQSDLQVPDVAETGLSFVENALIKARNAAYHSGLPAIADDSGIAVDALAGAPGIYSARYAGTPSDDARNNEKLLEALRDLPTEQRGARFHCVLVFLRHYLDPVPLICHGEWQGRILEQPAGRLGFGYDPLFFVPSHNCSAAELPPAIKNHISHRARAMACLLTALGIAEQLP